ncbi:hypothetical protein [Microbacterium paraoxydans]|uniref:hypothetical protein n=1 Tax=Microbacterium paraoxydans TaxID=199592 RepID=UPI003D71AB3C
MRRPFMDTPDQLTSLEGQQYLVLRPTGAVAANTGPSRRLRSAVWTRRSGIRTRST